MDWFGWMHKGRLQVSFIDEMIALEELTFLIGLGVLVGILVETCWKKKK